MTSPISNDMARTDDLVSFRIKPMTWEDKCQQRWRMFTADTPFGSFAYGTDIEGQHYFQSNVGVEENHPSEEAAKLAAEEEYRRLVRDTVATLAADPVEVAANL